MKFHLPTDYEIELVFKIEAVSIGSLPFFLLDLHWSNHIQSDWSAANATKNEVLIGVCTPLVAMKWLMFRTSQFFHVATEVIGMMGLFRCSRMAQESATSKVKTLLKWRNGSRNDEEYTARTTAFRDMISLLGIEDTSDLISNLFVEGIDIPVEWRRWLAEAPKTAKKQPIDDKRQERPEITTLASSPNVFSIGSYCPGTRLKKRNSIFKHPLYPRHYISAKVFPNADNCEANFIAISFLNIRRPQKYFDRL
ncbi:unnamed protein product [Hymenolepis diminuta]|uniref:Reverse transcriptase domain-containing protein n=1 Tax=Hymenolepis diminuta TaxID=6216 RepID=A0A0R3SXL2_HYMDI|nr:unnamed protein product [Hymenolepis diminuta]